MKVEFCTKEESNRLQEREFLGLSKAERFYRFLGMAERLKEFPTKKSMSSKEKKATFLIEIKSSSIAAMER